MSDKLNGTFDAGFSGIIDDDNPRKTMPDYVAALADKEAGYEPPEQEDAIDLGFGKNMGISRAPDTHNDESRIVESRKIEARDFKEEIEKATEQLLSEGQDLEEIEKSLTRKFPLSQVKKYFEASGDKILKKLGELALTYLNKKSYKECNKLEAALRDHKIRLQKEASLKVLKSFCDWAKNLKRLQQRTDPEGKVSFKRDADQKELQIRDLKENKDRNSVLAKLNVLSQIWSEYKQLRTAKLSNDQACVKLSKTYKSSLLESFYKKYGEEIKRLDKFNQRNSFQTNFAKLDNKAQVKDLDFENKNKPELKQVLLDVEPLMQTTSSVDSICRALEKKYGNIDSIRDIIKTHIKKFYSQKKRSSKQEESQLLHVPNSSATRNESIDNRTNYNDKQMLNYAFNLMTSGENLKNISVALKKAFGIEQTSRFMKENSKKLERHYGQLGYIFMDSNIYANCNEMKKTFDDTKHIGKQLMYSVKANKKCKGCADNKHGECAKVNLMISNHPLVRSSRAAKRVLTKASSFLPTSYIEKFASQINDDNNVQLISNFALGMRNARSQHNLKVASNSQDSINTQTSFVQADTMNVDLFDKSSVSRIVNNIMEENA